MALPTITSINPVFGPKGGGTTVVITGTNFTTPTVTKVTFDGLDAVSFSVDSGTQITAVSPNLGTAASVPLTVTNDSGSASFNFYYLNANQVPSAIITAVNPYFDPAANYTFFSAPEFFSIPNTPGGTFVLTYDPNTGTIGYDTAGGGIGAAFLITGNTVVAPATFGTLNNFDVSLKANNQDFLKFDATTNRLEINADQVQMNSADFGSFASGTTLAFEAVTAAGFGSLATPWVLIGNDTVGTNKVDINAPVLHLTNIPSATTADVLYYDSATKEVSYGAAGGGGAAFLLAGNAGTLGTATLGTTDNVTFNVITNNLSRIIFAASGDITFNNNTNSTIFNSGGVLINTANVRLSGIPSATTADIVYIDPTTKALSFGAAPSGAAAWLLDGSNTGPSHILGTASTDGFSMQTNSTAFFQVSAGQLVTWNGTVQFDASATTAARLDGATTLLGTTLATQVNIGRTAANLTQNFAVGQIIGATSAELTAPLVNLGSTATTVNIGISSATTSILGNNIDLPNLDTATTPALVYWDSAVGKITKGANTGFTSINMQVLSGSGTFTPSANAKYFIVEMKGAGAAGGGGASAGAKVGGSGGGGAYCRSVFDAATIGASQTYVIGAGGVPVSGADGGDGGNTTFGALMLARGGLGGLVTGVGGIGGQGGTSTGQFRTSGSYGGSSVIVGTAGLIGRPGAGTDAGGRGEVVFTGDSAGVAAAGIGSGGGGGYAATSDQFGGSGGDGMINVLEFI